MVATGEAQRLAARGTLNVDLLRRLDAGASVPNWLRAAQQQATRELVAWRTARGIAGLDAPDAVDPGDPGPEEASAAYFDALPARPDPQTRDAQLTEYLKCRADVVYFIDTYSSIEHKGRGVIPFRVWRWQAWLLYQWEAHPFTIVLKARQIGVSELAAASALHLIRFRDTKRVLFLSKGEDEAKELLGRSKIAATFLPYWLMPGTQQCLDACQLTKDN